MAKSKFQNFDVIRSHAKELRKNMTVEEKALWEILRNRKLNGYKFLRQHPIVYKGDLTRLNYFVADFYCSEKRAIIELDGPIHDRRIDYDIFRDSELKIKGLNVLRIKNEEIQNLDIVKEKIMNFLTTIKL